MEKRAQKILYVITKSNYGGAQRYVFELASHFKQAGYEVGVALGGTGILTEKLASVRIPFFPISAFQRDISVLKEFRAFIELYRTIRIARPDILHLNSSKAGFLGAFAGRLARVPQITFTAHGWPYLENRPWYWILVAKIGSWITALLVHQVIVVSHHDFSMSTMPGIQKKCTVIHPGVAHIPFLSRADARTILTDEYHVPIPKNHLIIATTAELVQNKNLRAAIQALGVLKKTTDAQVTYVIFGEGEERDALTAQIQALGLQHFVHLLGYVPDARMLLKACDIFLLPSLKEGLPYALLEAGAAGLPCIASNVGGIPEIIESGISGILIDPKDHTTITSALAYLVKSEEARHNFGGKLKNVIESYFGNTTMLEKTANVYLTNSRAT